MKKLLAVTALLVLGTAYADNEKKVPVQPKMTLAVVDISNKVARPLKERKYSVSNKNLRLCWNVFDVPFASGNANKITEIFTAPSEEAKFIKPGANVVKDKAVSYVHSNTRSVNNEYIQNCWQFDQNDPLGTYQFKLLLNNFEFSEVKFELVK